jgi:hypothetical protein
MGKTWRGGSDRFNAWDEKTVAAPAAKIIEK